MCAPLRISDLLPKAIELSANNASLIPQATPELTSSVSGIGNGHYCALTQTGALLCWGNNSAGQRGLLVLPTPR